MALPQASFPWTSLSSLLNDSCFSSCLSSVTLPAPVLCFLPKFFLLTSLSPLLVSWCQVASLCRGSPAPALVAHPDFNSPTRPAQLPQPSSLGAVSDGHTHTHARTHARTHTHTHTHTHMAEPSVLFAVRHAGSPHLCWVLAASQSTHLMGHLPGLRFALSKGVLLRQSLGTFVQKSPLAPCCCRIKLRILGPPPSWPWFSTLFPIALAALHTVWFLCLSAFYAVAHCWLISLKYPFPHLCGTEFYWFFKAQLDKPPPSFSLCSWRVSRARCVMSEAVTTCLPGFFWVLPRLRLVHSRIGGSLAALSWHRGAGLECWVRDW